MIKAATPLDEKTKEEKKKQRIALRKRAVAMQRQRDELAKKMVPDGPILLIREKFDVYDDGFTVFILCRSTSTFEERLDYWKKHKQKIIDWVIEDIKLQGRRMHVVKNTDYFKYYKTLLLRSTAEIEVEFKKIKEESGNGKNVPA